MAVFEEYQRPLTAAEHRSIQLKISALEKGWKSSVRRCLLVYPILFGALWALTICTSDAPWPMVTAFWLGVGILMATWTLVGEKLRRRQSGAWLADALSRNLADVIRVSSEELVEFEEIDDEGACYAFQVSDNEILFIEGQEFYSSAKFPNTNFEIVRIFDSRGSLAEEFIRKIGIKLKASRQVSAEVKRRLRMPEHLARVRGRLQDLEQILIRQ